MFTNLEDRAAAYDQARHNTQNGGDWPASTRRAKWINRRAKGRRHASTCAWFREGLRLSLVLWLGNRAYECGQSLRMNLSEKVKAA